MNARLRKEFRELFWPWCALMVIGVAYLAASRFAPELRNVARDLAWGAYFLGIPTLAALAFGSEFNSRTLWLLLSQPVPRWQIWKEKNLALLPFMLPLAAVYIMAVMVDWRSSGDVSLWIAFFVVTFCSAGFWSLVARSTLGGAIFTISAQFLVVAVVGYVVSILYDRDETEISQQVLHGTMLVTGMIAAPLALRFGWRRFSQLELVDNQPWSPNTISESLNVGCLTCGPRFVVLNLVRKELRLLAPVCIVAVVFATCYALFSLVAANASISGKHTIENALNIAISFYGMVVAVLCGCVPLSEERTLGVHAWNLTQPASVRVQWSIKLIVGVIISILLSVLLPSGLERLFSRGMEFYFADWKEAQWISCIMAVGTMVAFWSATQLSRTSYSILLTIGALFVVGVVFSSSYLLFGLLGTPVLNYLTIHFQLPLGFFYGGRGFNFLALLPFFIVISLQSWRAFRIPPQRVKALLGSGLKLFLVAVFCSTAYGTLAFSNRRMFELEGEIKKALIQLDPQDLEINEAKSTTVTMDQLLSTDRLSPPTVKWLRNSQITLSRKLFPTKVTTYWGQAKITFPNGRSDYITYQFTGSKPF